jgi:uncharacterized protein YcnI
MKKVVASVLAAIGVICMPAVAFAHVVVQPAQVETAAFQTFSVGVPNEKEVAVTGLRLVIPAGLGEVSPNVKPGWNIDIKKDGETVKEITWSGSSIPASQRDDFVFSAQAPENETSLNWKAYQTYADGSVVAWDQKPDGKDSEDSTPYSVTKVVKDLSATTTPASNDDNSTNTLAVAIGTLGVILGLAALITRRK